MARIIAVSNQKGGVGKTTTAVNLAACLAAGERRVLLMDLDPQGNSGSGLGIDTSYLKGTIYNVVVEEQSLKNVVLHTELKYLHFVPANQELIGAEVELVSVFGRETRLKEAIAEVEDMYDFIIIDCPPALGLLTVNALTAAHSLLIPVQCEYYALEGLSQLIKTVSLIKKRLNPTLEKEGILLTMYDKRNNICLQVEREIRDHFHDEVFKVPIPRNVKLSEAPSFGKPIILYDVGSSGAQAYLSLAREIFKKHAMTQLGKTPDLRDSYLPSRAGVRSSSSTTNSEELIQ